MGAGRMAGVVATVALGIVATFGCSDEQASRVIDGTTTTNAPGTLEGAFAIGEEIQLGDLRLTVHEVVDGIRPINPSTTIRPERHWIGVDVEVQNISTDPFTISGVIHFALQDATNEQYATREPDNNDGFPTIDGEIGAGGSRRGILIYEVPRNASGLRLFFAGDPLASGSAQILLTDQ